MRILHFTLGLGGGGRERRMVQLIRGLYQLCDYEQLVVSLDEHCDYPELWETPVKVIKIDFRPRTKFISEFEKIIQDFKPDILHSWVGSHQNSVLFPFFKRKYHFHYIVGHLADCIPISIIDYLYSLPSYWAADAIVSNSKLGLIAKKANRQNAHVIHNGFDFSRFNNNVEKNAKRKQLQIPLNAFVICMCARFHKSKDWKSFIELANITQKRNLNIYYLAVGKGETLDETQKIAAAYNLHNIAFLGQRKDIEDILQISDTSILFTNSAVHAEGISNSLMEAMAAGLPTIATNGGGTPELITDNENGFLIDDGNYIKAWEIIHHLVQDPKLKEHIGQAAEKHIKANYSLTEMTQQYINLYNTILND